MAVLQKVVLVSVIVLASLCTVVNAQKVTVSGTVYDISKKNPIEAVSVLSTSGAGTSTDMLGRYTLKVNEDDSIYFSYLNKATPFYPVANIGNLEAFNISILKKVQELPGIMLKQRNYRMDSLQNRLDYANIFNYKKPGFGLSTDRSPGGIGVGVDLDALINMFKFKKNNRMVAFQKRLLKQEEDRYIDHRFNKGLVKRLTGLESPAIDSFMSEFRPTLEMVQLFNDLELGQFIIEANKYFKAGIHIDRSVFLRQGL